MLSRAPFASELQDSIVFLNLGRLTSFLLGKKGPEYTESYDKLNRETSADKKKNSGLTRQQKNRPHAYDYT